MENFAQRLMKLRKEKGYTQNQLAEKIGVSNKSISRWETGEGFPDITILVPLADALGVSVDHLLRDGLDFHDIQKKDIEEYLPFVLATIGFIGYYILKKIEVSTIACIIGYFAVIYASHYLMLHHTDRKRTGLLSKVNALFNFLVIQNFSYGSIMLLQMASMMGISVFQLLSTGEANFYNIESILGSSFVISAIIAAGISAIIYSVNNSFAKKKMKDNK